MNLLCVAYGDCTHASSRARVFQWRPHLERAGIQTRVVAYNPRRARRFERWLDHPGLLRRFVGWWYYRVARPAGLTRLRPRLAIARRLRHCDVCLCHNVLLTRRLLRRAARRALVFDFVDAIYLDPANWSPERLNAQLAAADLVIVESAQNADYARQAGAREVLQIIGPIDCQRYRPAKKGSDPLTSGGLTPFPSVTLGWIGTEFNRPHLALIQPLLEDLLERHPAVRLETIGLDRPLFPHPRSANAAWSIETELDDLARFDIGLMPLPDDQWSRGKGGYKLLQYMALGVPSVASPVGVNREILTPECGILARTAEDWRAALEQLIADAALRRGLGAAARDRAVNVYSHEAATPKFVSALEGVITPADKPFDRLRAPCKVEGRRG